MRCIWEQNLPLLCNMRILVTGGAGFIGSNFIRFMLDKYPKSLIINYDKLTYAGDLERLRDLEIEPGYKFIKGDIRDAKRVEEVIKKYEVDYIVHFAAETHVDRSIDNPSSFVETNVLGTFVLLEAAKNNKIKRFHHVSTDEVYGALDLKTKEKFSDRSSYNPRSPYSASKAGSDHLVRSYFHTYNLPVTISNCSNNFGPFQDPEKFLPRAITNVIEGKKIPIYGDGKYVRDWIHVEDHCRAIDEILRNGKNGETYLVGGQDNQEISNIKIAKKILKFFAKSNSFLEKVEDRLGHDRKYSVDSSKIKKELGWEPLFEFDSWLIKTCEWYRENEWWWKPLKVKAEKFYKELKGMGDYIYAKQDIQKTSIPGLLVIKRPVFKDKRGYFKEILRMGYLTRIRGEEFEFKQWSHAMSLPRVIRGLHAENWNKIIYPVNGKMFAALVDVRPDSETFGKVETFNFDSDDQKALFIPGRVANSICVNGEEPVHYLYVVDAYYDASDTFAIAWDDPDLGIKWPIRKPIISDRDKNNPRLRDLFPAKFK